MIYLTGDTHGIHDFGKLLDNKLKHLTKEDYVIICGDCGVLFENDSSRIINLYEYLPFTVLFVDGNHENFDMLNKYPVCMWKGGKTHKISKTVFHLCRGQVFEIEGKTFFTFGGALSLDKARRTPGLSWWPEEEPSLEEYNEAILNLSRYDYKIDYVISHDCPSSWLGGVGESIKIMNEGFVEASSNILLEKVLQSISFRHWFFGHYHVDKIIDKYVTALYQQVVNIECYGRCSLYSGMSISGNNSRHKKPSMFARKKVVLIADNSCIAFGNCPPNNQAETSKTDDLSDQNDWLRFLANSLDAKFYYNISHKTTSEIIHEIKGIPPLMDSEDYLVLVMIGFDVFKSFRENSGFCKEIEDLLSELQRIVPSALIYVLGIADEETYRTDYPNNERINVAIESMGSDNNTHFIKVDSLHHEYMCDPFLFNTDRMYKAATIIRRHLLNSC